MASTEGRNPFVVPMAVAAALALFFISEGSYWQSLDTLRHLRNIHLEQLQAERLERNLTAAETHQRSYLRGGLPADLPPYAEARQASLDALDELDRSFHDDAADAPRLAELRALAQARLRDLDASIRLKQADDHALEPGPARENTGATAMARLRLLIQEILDEQSRERDRTNRSLSQTLQLNRLGVAALSGVLLLALVLYLRKSDALSRTQAGQQRLVQAAHDRLEAEVIERTAQLTDLTRHLLTAREDERNRLARNLHDDLGSLLTAAKLDAARVKSRLGSDAVEAHARLAELVDKLNSGIALGRDIIEDLRPSTLGHLGLEATLEILLRDFAARTGAQVHCDLHPARLTATTELVVYRVVQEAVTNISKYARAQQVWLTLGPAPGRPGWVAVTVRDDGAGFDAQAPTRSAYGLLGMRFRVEAEGGTLRLRSQPGQGTVVSVWLPERPDSGDGADEAAGVTGLACGQGPTAAGPSP